MKVAAFLPAKGSSQRIENKNLRLLDGKPLFLHTLEKLMSCRFIDEVFLDTESEEMIELARDSGCSIMRRDPELASNRTDGNQLFLNEVMHTDADIVVQVLCTSPFISEETLERAVATLRADASYDSAVLVRRDKQYRWEDGRPAYDIEHIPNSNTLPDTVMETMGLYAMRAEAARRLKRRIGEAPLMLDASPLEAIDVNWPEDMELANLIAAGRREQDRRLLANLRSLMNSSLLSDILDDLGLRHQVVKGLRPNMPHSRVVGRAKTLRLRALRPGEDFRGIYKALDSYRTIVPGDIIVVENEVPQHAYFGELNANLAVRAGAVAAIVGGQTRDSADVVNVGLPVFATGYTCQDVRKRATLDSINRPISMQGITVHPGDLVFADSEGVVVIPRQVEKQVVATALSNASNEKRLLIDIAQGIEVDALTEKYGFF
ncbi:RraA family protein [Rubrivivax gelatinosus]|uniref:CMP-N-acetylneuraminic acid synthetase n=1 Tax=Rubrivivax gelatinosus TaxID=28068 RepID=A0A4R2M360_RUBGE|nr:NTP transferase domain-containing protein [Rubrivivax gelatinosus]MBK1690094.1 cytidyltransferase [Rubrivivax gelatinosus]TCP01569.1 CMP-N-acetylneuraminic acid synthetase [Rubrivivax gelatinosus]